MYPPGGMHGEPPQYGHGYGSGHGSYGPEGYGHEGSRDAHYGGHGAVYGHGEKDHKSGSNAGMYAAGGALVGAGAGAWAMHEYSEFFLTSCYNNSSHID